HGWLVNLLLVLPVFYVLMIVSPLLSSMSWIVLVVAIAGFSWMIMSQIVKNQTKSLREREFVLAARFSGVSTFSILTRPSGPRGRLAPVAVPLPCGVPHHAAHLRLPHRRCAARCPRPDQRHIEGLSGSLQGLAARHPNATTSLRRSTTGVWHVRFSSERRHIQ